MPRFIAGADPRRMTDCPACGSHRFVPMESKGSLLGQRAVAAALLDPVAIMSWSVGKHCLDCAWQVG
jgi:hypothetical protein